MGQRPRDMDSAGHIVTDGRDKALGSSLLFLAIAIQMNNAPQSIFFPIFKA